jgi:chromosome partitioning protein
LADALLPVKEQYDYILIDCPPSLNMLTLNAMVAANSVLIPMQCEYYASGRAVVIDVYLAQAFATRSIRGCMLEGILRTMVDNRSRLGKDVSDQLTNTSVTRFSVPRYREIFGWPKRRAMGVPVMSIRQVIARCGGLYCFGRRMIRKEKAVEIMMQKETRIRSRLERVAR